MNDDICYKQGVRAESEVLDGGALYEYSSSQTVQLDGKEARAFRGSSVPFPLRDIVSE